MTPQHQRPEEPQGYFQETLFGEPEWIGPKKKRSKRASSSQAKPEPAPEPAPMRWERLRALSRPILGALRWIGEQATRFRGVAYAAGVLVVLTMTVLGLSYWEAKIWGYQFRIEKLPAPKEHKQEPKSGIVWGPIIIEKVTKGK